MNTHIFWKTLSTPDSLASVLLHVTRGRTVSALQGRQRVYDRIFQTKHRQRRYVDDFRQIVIIQRQS